MKKMMLMALMGAAAGIFSAPACPAQSANQGSGQAVVTILPKKESEAAIRVQQQDLRLKLNGKESSVTQWQSLRGPGHPLELVLLIDSSARSSLGQEMAEMQDFVKEMPANAKITIGYMENGRAALAGPLSSNPAQVLQGLHLPGGSLGSGSSPYFCLSDLAKHWPSQDRTARREVILITDGVDYYNLRYDPENPYVQMAIQDSVRAGLVVYSIYWMNQGRLDRSNYESNAGQNLLLAVTQATGGNSYWEGMGNPVSFEPYFRDLRVRFENQYRLSFAANLKGKPEVETMSLKVGGPAAKVVSPQQVFVAPANPAAGE